MDIVNLEAGVVSKGEKTTTISNVEVLPVALEHDFGGEVNGLPPDLRRLLVVLVDLQRARQPGDGVERFGVDLPGRDVAPARFLSAAGQASVQWSESRRR